MTIRFNIFRISVLACLMILGSPLIASVPTEPLDTLFAQLQNSQNEQEARELEHKIWMRWFESGDEEVDALMQQAMEKRRWYDFNGAIEILNQVLEKAPRYAEAWNQRATVYFHQQKFEKSLEDIARALELEPRHFGAMAGRAMIRLQQNRPALAIQNILEASKLHPFLKERAMFGL